MFIAPCLDEWCSPFFVLKIINRGGKQAVCVIQGQEQGSEEKTPLPSYSSAVGGKPGSV